MSGDVTVVSQMYPVGGLDWAAIMSDATEWRRYRARTEAHLADDFEMLPIQPYGSTRTVIVGVEAYLAGMRAVMDAFKSFRITAERFVPIEGGVLVFARLDGETLESGDRFSGEGGAIFQVEDGQIRRIHEFDNRDELLEAGGITAEDARERGISPDELNGDGDSP